MPKQMVSMVLSMAYLPSTTGTAAIVLSKLSVKMMESPSAAAATVPEIVYLLGAEEQAARSAVAGIKKRLLFM